MYVRAPICSQREKEKRGRGEEGKRGRGEEEKRRRGEPK
jgi:hypothetical protein